VQVEGKNLRLALTEAIVEYRKSSEIFTFTGDWTDKIDNFRNLKYTVSLHFKTLPKL
jgi:hypothetical protein